MSHPVIRQIIKERPVYSDKKEPVMLTSGKIGIYYLNSENVMLGSKEILTQYGHDSASLIRKATEAASKDPTFAKLIEIVAEEARKLFPESVPTEQRAIAGGQRRDWIFSGPAAALLHYPHISLYKDGRMYRLHPGDSTKLDECGGFYSVPVTDLLTTGSSSFDPRNTPPTGWIPMLRNGGVEVNDLLTVVSRREGGEERLAEADVLASSLFEVDRDFLDEVSSNKEVAFEYIEDPVKWCNNYIREHGINGFVSYFDPEKLKIDDRTTGFLIEYRDVLKENGGKLYEELRSKVLERFNVPIETLEVD